MTSGKASARDKGLRWGLALAAFFWALGLMFGLVFVGYGTMALLCAGLGCGALFYTLAFRRRWRRTMIAVSVILALGLGCFLAAEIPVIAGARSDEDPAADYLVVMGAGIRGLEPSLSLRDRLEAARDYLNEYPAAVAIVSGSQGPNEMASEASVMRRWLIEAGIDPARIVLEEQAGSTYENVLCSLALVEELGGNSAGRVAFVSSEYHLHRTRLIAEKLCCEPRMVAGHTSYFILMCNYLIREAFAVWELWVFGF